jgi:hypothetical protein
VAKLYRKGLDTLRKAEMKRLKNTLLQEEYTKLKNVMWILRKNKDHLNVSRKFQQSYRDVNKQ